MTGLSLDDRDFPDDGACPLMTEPVPASTVLRAPASTWSASGKTCAMSE